MKLALFPLPVFLLPEGVTRLRVFEPRYIRLVQESAGETGFVVLPINNLSAVEKNSTDKNLNWGSLVKIIDFSQGKDGLLHIDVKCESMVRVSNVEIESDGLKKAFIEVFNHWEQHPSASKEISCAESLTEELKTVFVQNPDLAKIYYETKFDCPVWVCQRWLELLPLKQSEQNLFAQPTSLSRANEFLTEIVFE